MNPETDRPNELPQPAPPPSEEGKWELVLERAAPGDAASPAAAPARAAHPWFLWAKALTPLVVVSFYILYKLLSGDGTPAAGARAPERAPEVRSLSGVKGAAPELAMDRPLRDFVARLESLAQADRWESVRSEIEKAPESHRAHTVVRALGAVARVRTGEKSAELERTVIELQAPLSTDDDFDALREQLMIAQARLITERCTTPELLLMNAETLHRLLDRLPPRPTTVDARLRVSQRFEQFGTARMKEASAVMSRNEAGMREARAFYQTALRWLVARDGWATLQPFAESFRPHIERNLGHLRSANAALNPPDLFSAERDRNTWTGKRGDPIHDAPR